jgi:AraC-like DNA-binding protein
MTPNHFIRSFKQYTGVSPGVFRKKKRMELACDMLVSTELQIGIISKEMGYDDSLYFSRAFKKYTGFSPSEYRSKNR